MNPFRNRALAAVGKALFLQILKAPTNDTALLLNRSNLFYALSKMPVVEGNLGFRLLDGLEESALFGSLLESAKPAIEYPTAPLSDTSFPAGGGSFNYDSDFTFVFIGGEIVFSDFEKHISDIGMARRVELEINSGGGDTRAALKLAETLHGREVEATVTGKAFSSAATLLQAATIRKAYDTARLMIHDSRSAILGTASELRMEAVHLDNIREKVKALFHRSPRALVEKWFESGDHYFNAPEALAVGLVDEIIPTPEPKPRFFPDKTPVESPLETDVDGDAKKLGTELLFRLRRTFADKRSFAELLKKF